MKQIIRLHNKYIIRWLFLSKTVVPHDYATSGEYELTGVQECCKLLYDSILNL